MLSLLKQTAIHKFEGIVKDWFWWQTGLRNYIIPNTKIKLEVEKGLWFTHMNFSKVKWFIFRLCSFMENQRRRWKRWRINVGYGSLIFRFKGAVKDWLSWETVVFKIINAKVEMKLEVERGLWFTHMNVVFLVTCNNK